MRLLVLLSLLLSLPAQAAWRPDAVAIEAMLKVPKAENDLAPHYAGLVVQALDVARAFADEHGWSKHMDDPYFKAVEVYPTQTMLWNRILQLHGLASRPLPTDGLTAALEEDVLLIVSPTEAARVRPEYFADEDDWMRALAHEIVHRLHVRILDGDEDAMGPSWFFEGFAVLGSGQRFGLSTSYADMAEALEKGTEGGRGSYARYAGLLRTALRGTRLQTLVDKAGREDFAEWMGDLKLAEPTPAPTPAAAQAE